MKRVGKRTSGVKQSTVRGPLSSFRGLVIGSLLERPSCRARAACVRVLPAAPSVGPLSSYAPTRKPADGQHLGTITHAAADGADAASPYVPPLYGGAPPAYGPAAFSQTYGQSAFSGQAGPPPFDPAAISAKSGLDESAIARARGAVFAPDEGEGEEAEDAAKEALKSVAKGVTKVRGCVLVCLCAARWLLLTRARVRRRGMQPAKEALKTVAKGVTKVRGCVSCVLRAVCGAVAAPDEGIRDQQHGHK